MMWLIYIVVIAVYIYSPTYIELIILIANMFMPDAIPYIDEAVMIATTVLKLTKGND